MIIRQNGIERQKMATICSNLGTDIDSVEQRLSDLGEDGLLVSRGDDDEMGYKFRKVRYFDSPGLHLNRFYYAMASLVLGKIKNVLEIGTGDALSTIALSRLFPEATIHTIDLPENDAMYKRWREKNSKGTIREKQRSRRLSRKNIVHFEKNTFFLPSLDLPNSFEFILVDGDHTYPQTAGDIMYAYGRAGKNCFIFFHDYYMPPKRGHPSCIVGEAVDWMASRIPEKLYIFPMGTPPGTPHEKMALVIKD